MKEQKNFLMNLLMIIFNLILFSHIYGLDINESNNVDVLKTLNAKNISCDLHDFVKSTNKLEDGYKVLIDDLTNYCSNSESTKPYRLLCHMILIELEIGCLLPNNSRPLAIQYTIPYTSKEICSINKIALTNNWIWQKLSSNEKEEIGSTSINLCLTITSLNNTLRLARFFYRIAPRIRRFDTLNTTSVDSVMNKIKPVKEIGLEDTKLGLIKPEDRLSINKIHEDSINLNHSDKDTGIIPEPLELNITKINNNENFGDSVNGEEILNIEDKQPIQEDHIHEQVDLKDENRIEKQSVNELKKNEEGLPLGRAGEKPEREQINERPKPKALDVESVFKGNDHEERNWVEGKHADNQPENRLDINSNRFPQMKFDENSLDIPPPPRKRPSLRLKSNRNSDNNNDLSNHFVTSFLLFILCIIIIYLILHNKNKILGLIIEGCKRRRTIKGRGTLSHHTRLS